MDITEYQEKASEYAVYANSMYPYFGLIEEVGELYSYHARWYRKDPDYSTLSEETDIAMQKEIGDILWNLTQIANDNSWCMDEIAQMNLDKLEDRKERGVLKGKGDER